MGSIEIVEGRIKSRTMEGGKQIIEVVTGDEHLFKKGEWVMLSPTKTERQMRFIHALWGDIAEHQGELKEDIKVIFKDAIELDSMVNASKDELRLLIDITLAFIKKHDIPLNQKTVQAMEADDVVSVCLYKKVCLICGKPADIHHVDRVGAGKDRKQFDKEYPEAQKLPFCRIHHTELHTLGNTAFREKYLLGDEYSKHFERILRR